MDLQTDEIFAPENACMLNALQLAYIGDAVWEVLIRDIMIRRRLNLHHMHSECVKRVNAHAQAGYLNCIQNILDEQEAEIVRRGRNAHALTRAKNASVADYRRATGLEALIGYLYLKEDFERMMWLIHTGISTFHEESKHE